MATLGEIEQAVESLPEADFALFRAWFERLDAARFDDRIAQDARAGRLDALAEEALAERREGATRPL